MKVEKDFIKADSANLPKVDSFMIANFFASNPDFCSAEFRNVKTSVSSRQSYGDDAIGYVQLKRDQTLCTVKCRMCLEHKVRQTSYSVSMVIDEKEGVVNFTTRKQLWFGIANDAIREWGSHRSTYIAQFSKTLNFDLHLKQRSKHSILKYKYFKPLLHRQTHGWILTKLIMQPITINCSETGTFTAEKQGKIGVTYFLLKWRLCRFSFRRWRSRLSRSSGGLTAAGTPDSYFIVKFDDLDFRDSR
ncbi:hypothetical protein EVAR_66576_1 [Eumeta japonica]|uniref:Uncharacterized protein n=1 Tax=Eumeta variegata TaxID=151549 RepID=A0A4C1Z5G0_EUMVA|nr:hypothetical protein EVAR_66576_1 [Eumeta japonica]